MFNQLLKVSSIVAISSLSLAVSSMESIQASELEKEAFYVFAGGDSDGYVTGTISLLYNNPNDLFILDASFKTGPLYPPFTFASPSSIVLEGDVSFDIDEFGFLVGVYGSDNGEYTFGDGRDCGPDGGCSLGKGSYIVSLNGDQYTLSHTFTIQEYNIFGDFIDEYTYTSIESQAEIGFYQIQPVEVVPEPLTILGAVTAMGFGTLFKKLQK